MRKSVKQQLALRVLSTAALMAMVSSIATAAFAAEYNVKDGSVEIVAKDGIQSITQRTKTEMPLAGTPASCWRAATMLALVSAAAAAATI